MQAIGNFTKTYVRALMAGVVKTINSSSDLMKIIILEYACRWLGPWNEAVGTGIKFALPRLPKTEIRTPLFSGQEAVVLTVLAVWTFTSSPNLFAYKSTILREELQFASVQKSE